jgi:hypothetical protein
MASIVEVDPEQLDPAWQLPVFVDQVRRIHLDLFAGYLRRAELALDEIGEQPDCPDHDETNAQLALRHVRLGLANYNPPMAGIALREVRRDTLLKFFDTCQEMVRDLLRGWGEPALKVADLRRNLSLASPLVEMICLMVECSDLGRNPVEKVIDTLSWMIDYASAIRGDSEMRERDEEVTMGTRLANIELEELAMPMVLRLSQVHALLERHRVTSPAPHIREV